MSKDTVMIMEWSLLVIVSACVLPVAASLLFRLLLMRSSGTPVLLRFTETENSKLPLSAGWRHGAIRYSDTAASYYRLVSLRFTPDAVVLRNTIEILDRRLPYGDECEVIEDDETIVVVRAQVKGNGKVTVELALDAESQTALLSWIEACSLQRQSPLTRS